MHSNVGPTSRSAIKDGRIAHIRPRPGRRRSSMIALLQTLTSIILLVCAVSVPAMAAPPHPLSDPAGGELEVYAVDHNSFMDIPTEILFDHRPRLEPELYRRQLLDVNPSSSSTQKAAATTSTAGSVSSASSAAASASPSDSSSNSDILTAPSSTDSPLPKPFDGGLGTNYTQPGCLDFLSKMINNDTFTSCLPFSALLQNSISFFMASRTTPTITQTLDASCNVVFPACSSLMSDYALTLRSQSACSADFDRENPIVRQAYNGLLSYDILYRASCLHANPTPYNNQSSDYCFADAVTNLTSPSDSYIYYLPLGIPLPAGTMPTCNSCLKDTMGVYATQVGNKTQPLSLTYADSARLVNTKCGPNFVNSSVPSMAGNGMKSAASTTVHPVSVWLILGLMAIAAMFVL